MGKVFQASEDGYLELQGRGQEQKGVFCNWNDPSKVCRQICQGLKIGILKVFLEYNAGEKTI